MTTFLMVLGFFLAAVVLMALGVIFANKPLRGSCGGLGKIRHLLGLGPCPSCDDEDKADTCKRAKRKQEDESERAPIEV